MEQGKSKGKVFSFDCPRRRSLNPAATENEQKFFGSFFQKRTSSFPSLSIARAVP
jgi:hypothetical protein